MNIHSIIYGIEGLLRLITIVTFHAVVGVFSTHNTCVSNTPTVKIFIYFIDIQYINHKKFFILKSGALLSQVLLVEKIPTTAQNTNNGTNGCYSSALRDVPQGISKYR